VISQPDDARDLDGQFAEIDGVLRGPWVPPDAGQPRVLTHDAYAEVLQSIKRGGLTSLDPATIEAVRGGAQPGDPLPPLPPDYHIDHVTDPAVIFTGSGQERLVAVLFSHQHFPGVRFGYRFSPYGDGRWAALALVEAIETGELHRMMSVPRPPDKAGIVWTWGLPAPGLDGQYDGLEAAFALGWRPVGVGEPRFLTERAYADARRVVSRGGWTGLDQATIEAVRGGAQPGDPLPPLQAAPYIRGVTDTEVIITGTGQGRRVAVLFSYTDFPGVRFGHRFPPGLDGHGDPLYLMEEIETGALHRMMQTPPPADTHGITWTTWGDPVQEPELFSPPAAGRTGPAPDARRGGDGRYPAPCAENRP
jgi:hypothetical protein